MNQRSALFVFFLQTTASAGLADTEPPAVSQVPGGSESIDKPLSETAPPRSLSDIEEAALGGEDETWRDDFVRAKAELLAGNLAEARDSLQTLSAEAVTTEGLLLATELFDVASGWTQQGMVLVPRRQYETSDLASKAVNTRSTGEIAQLYIAATAYGLGTGAYLDVVLDVEGEEVVWMPLIGGALAAGGVFWLDAADSFAYGVPQSISTGLLIGLEEGILWASYWDATKRNSGTPRVFDPPAERDPEYGYPENGYQEEYESGLSDAEFASVVWGSATAGALVGGLVGSSAPTTPGRSAYVGSLGTWSGVLGLLLPGAASEDAEDTAILLTGGVLLNAGVVAGLLTAGDVSPSEGRVRFADLGAIAGGVGMGLLGVGLHEVHGDSMQAVLWMAAAGVAGGYGLSWYLTRNMEKDVPFGDGAAIHSMHVGVAPAPGGGSLSVRGTF